jgi:DNA (cytosine-5)-methyltransferase 1
MQIPSRMRAPDYAGDVHYPTPGLGYELADDEIVVDSFAGGGGVSTGFEMALGLSPHVAINHNPVALGVHAANHPETVHLVNDVFAVEPHDAVPAGKRVGVFWSSPDCRSFSRARGKAPVSAPVRDLAWVVIKWARAVRPRVICLENVPEFLDWGPVGANGRPVKTRVGETFRDWRRQLEGLGYVVDHRMFVAADYGAATTRRRLFLVARCDGLPIRWPQPTHARDRSGLFDGRLRPWLTGRDVLDFHEPVHSIFLTQEQGRLVGVKRPLVEKTMRRIARGMYMKVVETSEPCIVSYYGEKRPDEGFRGRGLDETLPTQTTANRFGLVVPLTHAGDDRVYGADDTLRTITSAHRGEFGFVAPTLIQVGYGERDGQQPRVPGLTKPLGTMVAGGNKHALVTAHVGEADAPAPVVVDRSEEVARFLWDYRRYATREVGLSRSGRIVYDGREMRIADIGMRMITPREMANSHGFPRSYRIERTADGRPLTLTQQTSLLGNSVPPPMAAAIIAANVRPPAPSLRLAA